MKIAISSTGTNLEAAVDPRFGRAKYFIIADTESSEIESIDNENMMAGGGAGIATAQMVANKGAKVVLTGNCGPNAYETLSAAGVEIVTGVSGTVKSAIEGFKTGQLRAATQANVESHYGTGRGAQKASTTPPTQPTGMEQEVQSLKNQIYSLTQQVQDLQQRLQELDEKQ